MEVKLKELDKVEVKNLIVTFYTVEGYPDILVAVFEGELVAYNTEEVFSEKKDTLFTKHVWNKTPAVGGWKTIIIDLQMITYINSSGAARIVTTCSTFRKNKINTILVLEESSYTTEILRTVGFFTMKIHCNMDSKESALMEVLSGNIKFN